MRLSYNLIKYYFEVGAYDLRDVANCVILKVITKEQFHFITGYSYEAIMGESN